MPILNMTDILTELRKDPPPRPEPDFGPGPLPGTYVIAAEDLAALLADHHRLDRVAAFLRSGGVDTSISTVHDGSMHEEPEAQNDPHGQWNSRRWSMGFSIETEHDGCYRWVSLATGRDFRDTVDRGLANWDEHGIDWCLQDAGREEGGA